MVWPALTCADLFELWGPLGKNVASRFVPIVLSLSHTQQSARLTHTDFRQPALELVRLSRRDYVTTVEVVDARPDVGPADLKLVEPDELEAIVEGPDGALVGDVDIAVGVHANVLNATVLTGAAVRAGVDVVGAAAPADVWGGAVDVGVTATAGSPLLLLLRQPKVNQVSNEFSIMKGKPNDHIQYIYFCFNNEGMNVGVRQQQKYHKSPFSFFFCLPNFTPSYFKFPIQEAQIGA